MNPLRPNKTGLRPELPDSGDRRHHPRADLFPGAAPARTGRFRCTSFTISQRMPTLCRTCCSTGSESARRSPLGWERPRAQRSTGGLPLLTNSPREELMTWQYPDRLAGGIADDIW
jgi:hypothetical protein